MNVLITGGCGFIGTNLALERLAKGDQVRVLDNCSRAGTERNRAHLESLNDANLDLVDGDIRDADLTAKAAADADVIFHLAAQVAVTASVTDPRTDFDINALGTLNVLEGARLLRPQAALRLRLDQQGLRRARGRRGRGAGDALRPRRASRSACPRRGRSTSTRRTAARRARPTCTRSTTRGSTASRPSSSASRCIYGPWQYGNEDQGWIAHFLIRALNGEGITLYGDGKQVRDVLYVADLLELYDAAVQAPEKVAGRAYNIGGGPDFTTSLLEFVDHMRNGEGLDVEVSHGEWRPGDQRVYISDIRRAEADLGWAPRTSFAEGTGRLRSLARDYARPSAHRLRGRGRLHAVLRP